MAREYLPKDHCTPLEAAAKLQVMLARLVPVERNDKYMVCGRSCTNDVHITLREDGQGMLARLYKGGEELTVRRLSDTSVDEFLRMVVAAVAVLLIEGFDD